MCSHLCHDCIPMRQLSDEAAVEILNFLQVFTLDFEIRRYCFRNYPLQNVLPQYRHPMCPWNQQQRHPENGGYRLGQLRIAPALRRGIVQKYPQHSGHGGDRHSVPVMGSVIDKYSSTSLGRKCGNSRLLALHQIRKSRTRHRQPTMVELLKPRSSRIHRQY